MQARPSGPTAVPGLTNALLTEWAQIPRDRLQNLMERLTRRVEAVIAAKERLHINANGFGMGFPTNSCRCDIKVSTYF